MALTLFVSSDTLADGIVKRDNKLTQIQDRDNLL